MVLDVISWLLMALVLFNLYVLSRLVRAEWLPDPPPALRERTWVQVIFTLKAGLWAALGAVQLGYLSTELVAPILIAAAFLASVPAAVWLYWDIKGW